MDPKEQAKSKALGKKTNLKNTFKAEFLVKKTA